LIHDKPLLAALLGCLSSIPYELFTRVLLSFGIGKYSVYQLASLIVTLYRPNYFLGIIVCMSISCVIATIFYFQLEKLGWNYLIIKSSTIGVVSWIITEAIFTWLIEGPRLIPHRPISDYYIELFGALVFGIWLGILFKKYLLNNTSN
jgi:hypothetical protein